MAGEVDCILDDWRQGDLALAPIELPVVVLDDGDLAWQALDAPNGVVVLSQSCDIVRDVEKRPYVQIAGLVAATDGEIAKAIRREFPSRIHLDCLIERKLLIDLDVTATVHKSAVAKWERTPGCSVDEERRRIAAAFARHRQRFAFPDKFNDLIKPVRGWIESKRSKQSFQGEFVRALREVRVICDSWDTPSDLTFLAIVDQLPSDVELAEWEKCAKALEAKAAHDEFPQGEFRIVTYDDISARDYLNSDRLDWDGLSEA